MELKNCREFDENIWIYYKHKLADVAGTITAN